MFKFVVSIFIFTTVLSSISSQSLNISQVKQRLKEKTEKLVLLWMVTDLSNFSKTNEILTTDNGRQFVASWLNEITSLLCHFFDFSRPYFATTRGLENYVDMLKFNYVETLANRYYDVRRNSPWPKIIYDPATQNVTMDTSNPNQIKDRNVTDPIITNSDIEEMIKCPFLTHVYENTGYIDNEERKKFQGKRSSLKNFIATMKKANFNILHLFKYKEELPKLQGNFEA